MGNVFGIDLCAFASKLCSDVLDILWKSGLKHAAYIYYVETYRAELHKALEEVKALKDDVMGTVRVAEKDENKQRTATADLWMRRVADERTKGNELIRDQKVERGWWQQHVRRRHALGKKLFICKEDVKKLTSTKPEIGELVAEHSKKKLPKEKKDCDDDLPEYLCARKREVWEYLREEGVALVGVLGRKTGVGKTTILKHIYNHYLETERDFLVIWIDMIYVLKKKETVQEAIRKEIGILNDWKYETPTEQADYIARSTLNEKKFILLLDNITEQQDLSLFGVTSPALAKNGSTVVITTCLLNVNTCCCPFNVGFKIGFLFFQLRWGNLSQKVARNLCMELLMSWLPNFSSFYN